MERKQQINLIAQQLQAECHKTVKEIMNEGMDKGLNFSYQDATNAYIFAQLAILQDRINTLENPVTIFKNGV